MQHDRLTRRRPLSESLAPPPSHDDGPAAGPPVVAEAPAIVAAPVESTALEQAEQQPTPEATVAPLAAGAGHSFERIAIWPGGAAPDPPDDGPHDPKRSRLSAGSAMLVQRDVDPNAPVPDPNAVLPGGNVSQPEPLTGGAGASGTTTIAVKNATRVVSGSTLTYAWNSLTNSGAREAASVQPAFTPAPQYEYDDNDRVKKAVVSVVETKEMPQWSELDAQCPPIKAEWNRFYAVLDAHENKHLAIDKKHFENVHLKAVGKVREAAWKAIDDEIDAANKENEAYDTQSNHGVNEGANINSAVQCAPEKVGSSDAPPEESAGVQAKLAVGAPSDPLESEADRVADGVLRREEPPPNLGPRAGAPTPLSDADDRRIQSVVHAEGQRLDPETTQYMSGQIGHDFSRVRVHTDTRAAESATGIRALAYTLGSDIVFASGQYAPHSDLGRRLLAHELTHVVQQGESEPVSVQRGVVPGFLRSDAGTKEQIEAAIKSEDPADIKAIDDFSQAEPPQKAQLVQILLNKTTLWTFDKRAMVRIWNSFGDLEALNENQVSLLRTCVDRGFDMTDLKGYPFLAGGFRDSVKRQVLENLMENIALIQKESDRLGLAGDKPKEGEKYDAEMQKLQDLAALIQDAKLMLAKARKIVVAHTGSLESLRTGKDEGLLGGKPITFDPEREPVTPNAVPVTQSEKSRGEMPWAVVYPAYAMFTETIADVLAQNPSLYALQILGEPMQASSPTKPGQDAPLVYGDQSRLTGFEMLAPKQAREKVGKALLDVYNNARMTLAKVMGGKMSPLQFDLVVDRHKKGQVDARWGKPYAKFVADRVVADDKPSFDEAMEMIGIVLLLGAVAIGTGGAATPLMGLILAGANLGTAAAAAAFKTFEAADVQQAANSAASAKTAVTSQQRADRAALDAQMYQFMAIAAFAGEALGPLLSAGRAGSNLGALDLLAPAERATALTDALEEMEVGQVAMRTGKQPEALADIVAVRAATDPKAKSALDKIKDFIGGLARPFGTPRGAGTLDNLSGLDRQAACELVEKSVISEGIEATLTKSKKTVNELLEVVGDQSVVTGRLKEFMALPETLTKLTPEELGQRLALFASEARKNAKTAASLLQLGVERLGPLKALRRAGGWEAIVKALGSEASAMSGIVAWRDSALADLFTHLTNLGAGGMEEAQEFLARRMGGTIEELGLGTANPVVHGTGVKDLESLLLRVSDNRALADKGLLAAGALKKMAQEGGALRDTWKTLTPKERGNKLLELANARLKEAGVPPMKFFDFAADDDGLFLRSRWSFYLRESLLANEAKFDWLLEATYHEARHAEQAYQIARVKAKSMSVELMEQGVARGGLGIDREVAEAAKRVPIEPVSAEGRQALAWFDSMMGTGTGQREIIYREMDEAYDAWQIELASYLENSKRTPELEVELRQFEQKAFMNYNNTVKRYVALPEEADAYMVQARFKEAYARHSAALEGPATVRTGKAP